MSTGLIALLDDVAALAKVAAASLDDAAAQASKAGAKAAGIVIDDAAVTPRYVVGFTADRELPIIWKIAVGSLKNKLLFLLPGALVLNFIAPWIIVPLLMLGGLYLCLEGYEKVHDLVSPHGKDAHVKKPPDDDGDGKPDMTMAEFEDAKVASAIRTDFILSAEIMAITLAAVATAPVWLQGGVLAMVGLGMTLLVYGAVAIIVKADDVGLAWSRSSNAGLAGLGRGIVSGMPTFLKVLSYIGMVAMLWVGGGIIIHGLYELGFKTPEYTLKGWAQAVGALAPAASGFVGWLVTAGVGAIVGLALGAVVAPIAHHVLVPLAKAAGDLIPRKTPA
jgi:uncharacterized protein